MLTQPAGSSGHRSGRLFYVWTRIEGGHFRLWCDL